MNARRLLATLLGALVIASMVTAMVTPASAAPVRSTTASQRRDNGFMYWDYNPGHKPAVDSSAGVYIAGPGILDCTGRECGYLARSNGALRKHLLKGEKITSGTRAYVRGKRRITLSWYGAPLDYHKWFHGKPYRLATAELQISGIPESAWNH